MIAPLLAISGAFCLSLYAALIARILRSGEPSPFPFVRSLMVQVLTSLLVGLSLVAQIIWVQPEPLAQLRSGIGGLMFIALACHMVSQLLYFEALRFTDVALVGSFAALSPIATVITGWVVFEELPRPTALCGIALISCGIVCMHMPALRSRTNQCSNAPSGTWNGRGLLLAFASGLIPAFGQTAAKGAILQSSVSVYQALTLTLTGTLSLAVLCCIPRRTLHADGIRGKDIRPIVLLSALFGLGSFLLSAALMTTYIANVSGMSRISIVFHVILAYFINAQRSRLPWRVAWATVIFVGVLLIAVSG